MRSDILIYIAIDTFAYQNHYEPKLNRESVDGLIIGTCSSDSPIAGSSDKKARG